MRPTSPCSTLSPRPPRPIHPHKPGATYVGLIPAGLEDELLRLVLPVLDWGVRGSQAGGAQGQL